MNNIKITNSFSTGLDVFFDRSIKTVGVADKYLGRGGFGIVYEVETIDNQKPPLPLVAKMFHQGKERNFETVVRLQRLVMLEAQQLSKQGVLFFDQYPSLIALPLSSFDGVFNGTQVQGYLAINLNKLGFISLDDIFMNDEDLEPWARFQGRALAVKYKMAYDLAKSCAFLRKIHFIHADITPDNMFVHKYEPLCVLIDFDSGAIIDSRTDMPTTEGKDCCGDWTPPEMICEGIVLPTDDNVLQPLQSNKKRLTASVDDWAFNVTIHYLLTGHPVFFTKDRWPSTMKLYEEMYRDGSCVWPDISTESKYMVLYDEENLRALSQYHEYYDKLEESVKRGFEFTFSMGATSLAYRHDAKWWIPVLNKCVATSPFQVKLTWRMLKDYVNKFPDIQSSKSTLIPKTWTDKIHFSKDKTSNSFEQYVNDLIPDLINGSQKLSVHESIILKMAKENGKNEYLDDLKDFLDLFKECVKDKKITRLEYNNLRLQARMLGVKQDTLDKLLEPYEILK